MSERRHSRLLDRVLGRLGCVLSTRSLIFMSVHVPALPIDVECETGLREVPAAEVASHTMYTDGWFDRERILERLRQGGQLFALRQDGEDVCFGWVERNRAEVRWVALAFTLPPNVGYLTGLYTRPPYRGRGLGIKMVRARLAECRRRGIEHAFMVVDATNDASLQLHRKLGFREYQRLDYRRVLFLNSYRITCAHSGQSRRRYRFLAGPRDAWKSFWVPSV